MIQHVSSRPGWPDPLPAEHPIEHRARSGGAFLTARLGCLQDLDKRCRSQKKKKLFLTQSEIRASVTLLCHSLGPLSCSERPEDCRMQGVSPLVTIQALILGSIRGTSQIPVRYHRDIQVDVGGH